MRRFSIAALVLVGVLGAASAGIAAASGWSIQHTPNPRASSSRNVLWGVSCTSGSACTAVGEDETSHGTTTVAGRWNGNRWSTQHTPNPGSKGGVLTGVSCTSVSACTAVGHYTPSGASFSAGTLAERWNGTRWSIQHTPNPGSGSVLTGVSCTSRSACTAVGYYTTGNQSPLPEQGNLPAMLAEHWNGTTWSIQPTPNPGLGSVLTDVSCTSRSACTAVGFYLPTFNTSAMLAERWNGTSWSIQPTPSPGSNGELSGVSCTSGSACTAVGTYATGNTPAMLAERWNGTTWSIQPTPNPGGGGLDGVSCTSASACTAVGGRMTDTLAERWNGTRWSIQHTPNPSTFSGLIDVSCASGRACTAVGTYGNPNTRTFAERWSGG